MGLASAATRWAGRSEFDGSEGRGSLGRQLVEVAAGQANYLFGGDVASHAHHGVGRHVPGIHIAQEVLALQGGDGLLVASGAPAHGLVAEDGLVSSSPTQMPGWSRLRRNLLLDHRPFSVNLDAIQQRVEEHVRQDIQSQLELVEGEMVPEAGDLLCGVGVEDAARPFDGLGDGHSRRAPLTALEHHVLQEMSQSLEKAILGPRARPDEQANANRLGGGQGRNHYPQAIGELGDLPGDGHLRPQFLDRESTLEQAAPV